MPLTDYSLERFPEHLIEQLEDSDCVELTIDLPDIQAEDQAHRSNLMIATWIERLATSESHCIFMPDHTHIGLHHVDLAADVQTEKFEVGFFCKKTSSLFVPPTPFLTLYYWRVQQQGFGLIWTSLGFRCEEISAEAEEAIYQQVLTAARCDRRER